MIITTPYGPWEAIGYREHYPWRAHLWHFEREDLHEMFGQYSNFKILCIPGGTHEGSVIGSYVTTFIKGNDSAVREIDYGRKFNNLSGRETISLCMIAKDCEETILSCLRSVKDLASEINIYLDPNCNYETEDIIEYYREEFKLWPIINTRYLTDSPLDIGFDAARNESITEASGDWVMWLDTDEKVNYPERLYPGLRPNAWNGYGIAQHHFSVEPLGVLKTDVPVRLFRNNQGVKFFGMVHEHPEKKINEGVGYSKQYAGVDILHHGYTNERIRRGRFDRNIDLMIKDREKYPERLLGKFLWIRDLSQMCGYEIERNGGDLSEAMIERAKEGIKLWDELLEAGQVKMLVDGIEFYSRLVGLLGSGFEASMKLDTSKYPGDTRVEQIVPITGLFRNEEDANKFFSAILHEKVINYV
jgi:glycosyltransferase involved in cell wall biosynthesis